MLYTVGMHSLWPILGAKSSILPPVVIIRVEPPAVQSIFKIMFDILELKCVFNLVWRIKILFTAQNHAEMKKKTYNFGNFRHPRGSIEIGVKLFIFDFDCFWSFL